MKEVYFKEIMIADMQNETARIQPFEKGLNVVTSVDNHMGKSSLLKSMYYTLVWLSPGRVMSNRRLCPAYPRDVPFLPARRCVPVGVSSAFFRPEDKKGKYYSSR